ncbi:MAG: TIGR02996 domain-containing protein [Planctomycetes bacterium]|nr:TIGR02996 domain-containing protein [Planctomycetota bacterium]
MSDETALLKAIVAHPDEDMPRLAYADWLDENKPDSVPSPAVGPSARAEFIRTQCRLAVGAFDDPNYPELREREKDLADWLATHDPERDLQLSGFDQYGETDGEWADRRRGFHEVFYFDDYGESAEDTIETLTDCLKEGFLKSPARSLVLDDATTEEIVLLTQHKFFKQLRGLHLDYISGEETAAIAAIADSPQSTGLRRLFFDLELNEGECRALAESPHLGNLESLIIDYPISARALKRFHGVKWFRNLRRLHLWGGAGDILGTLGELPRMPRLISLTLNGGWNQSRAAVRRFVTSDSFPNLAYLELSSTLLGPDHVALLATAKWPLRHLVVEQAQIRKAGCETIAAAPFAKKLRVLSLRGSEVTAGGVQALADSPNLAGLRHLDLGGNPIGPGGLAALAGSKHLRGLRSLNLGHTNHARNPLAARHIVEFLSSLDMPNLRHLNLNALPVAVRGARLLATLPTFTNLTRLELDQCSLGNAGTTALAESTTLANLVHLDLYGNKVGSAAGKFGNPKVFPKLGMCRLGHGIPKNAIRRLNRRPGILV